MILGASFTATPHLAFPPQGWTLDWYRAMLAEPGYAAAFATSTVLALAATAAAVLLTVPAPRWRATNSRARRRCRRC